MRMGEGSRGRFEFARMNEGDITREIQIRSEAGRRARGEDSNSLECGISSDDSSLLECGGKDRAQRFDFARVREGVITRDRSNSLE